MAGEYWAGLQTFMSEQMVPKYKNLLSGVVGSDVQVQPAVNANEEDFFNVMEVLFKKVVENPEEVQMMQLNLLFSLSLILGNYLQNNGDSLCMSTVHKHFILTHWLTCIINS